MCALISNNLGFPRIGENREWKKALETFWAGKLDVNDFSQQIEEIRLHNLRIQQQKGIELIPVGDFSLYDHVLDTATISLAFKESPSFLGYLPIWLSFSEKSWMVSPLPRLAGCNRMAHVV